MARVKIAIDYIILNVKNCVSNGKKGRVRGKMKRNILSSLETVGNC